MSLFSIYLASCYVDISIRGTAKSSVNISNKLIMRSMQGQTGSPCRI